MVVLQAGLQYIPQYDLPPASLAALYRLGEWMSEKAAAAAVAAAAADWTGRFHT